ncbi:DNA (cytosine-5-)-methyltransferase [Bacillus pseudomycoides]|uniref:DNA (cytosine-5-)-methyltransferase n=1 Tax=Bacillus pseudomycoides TaxID=64104 RepID=UPI000BEE8071|nr:DNA (cytosine-5-)-methyltransferase [Bacillus pseudomycoides]PDX99847.1 DNA (cytosine-5-)-methyltransferase [Bacillus pseudomycoides]PEK82194.1 DNA (cytosine-5-)-methyltransferase [Bacillus pseudomycoides]PEN09869.1 DNA (cytosine-5-)-methyltransferase [Bacillus pseudomycoides]PGB88172.1 DNA (cytosine-5-)-methyltransferase [Bacillus pseudomycoides]PHG29269.1 DNA (cytosine-5-)-methyltransferase [Bacillus pseudomycoides]
MTKVKFIDLFAGMGGLRTGFEQAFAENEIETECVFTSEIKKSAIKVLHDNFPHDKFAGDITKVGVEEIPEFDFLLAGFPCQPFSSGGKRLGFADTRGTLFFEIQRILEERRPYGFLLENVEGLVKHDLENKKDPIGRTLTTILRVLESLGYNTTWKVLDSKDFGLPQSRKRIFIAGTRTDEISLEGFELKSSTLKDILLSGLPTVDSAFTQMLFKNFKPEELYGKSIKDKRGGKNNIHSWDLGLKGEVSPEQKQLLEMLLKERRKKHWAEKKQMEWMDGMPLTLEEIQTFYKHDNTKEMLEDLTEKGYLKFEHPRSLVEEFREDGSIVKVRRPDPNIEKGYNIVTGKLSFEFNTILNPNGLAPTIVATDVSRIGIVDGDGLRRLTLQEGLKLFGFPDKFKFNVSADEGFDLLGNTVSVPVVKAICNRLSNSYISNHLTAVSK